MVSLMAQVSGLLNKGFVSLTELSCFHGALFYWMGSSPLTAKRQRFLEIPCIIPHHITHCPTSQTHRLKLQPDELLAQMLQLECHEIFFLCGARHLELGTGLLVWQEYEACTQRGISARWLVWKKLRRELALLVLSLSHCGGLRVADSGL